MGDWQDRVIEEKQELDKKIIKLSTFQKTDGFQRMQIEAEGDYVLLKNQLRVMKKYSKLLELRIKRF